MSVYLSLVVTSRNDNYGLNMIPRFENFLHAFTGLAERVKLDCELIIVDWNPPTDRPPIAEQFAWPTGLKHCSIRILTVPPELHAKVDNPKGYPLMEYLGKNAAIRRAAGRFVLASNPDNIFSEPLMRHLARQDLDDQRSYRVVRWDVKPMPATDLTLDEKLAHCRAHVFERGFYGTVLPVTPSGFRIPSPVEIKLRTQLLSKRLRKGITYRLQTWASGDFMLMAKSAWERIGGYPQLPVRGALDNYACFIAHVAGFRQKMLPGNCRMYHQDHSRHQEHGRVGRVTQSENYEDYRRERDKMVATGKPMLINDEHWGLAGEDLPERRVA